MTAFEILLAAPKEYWLDLLARFGVAALVAIPTCVVFIYVLMRSEATKRECVMALLKDGAELYGKDLIDRSNGVLSRGTVYVTLSRMEEEGLIVSKPDAVSWQRVYRRAK